MSGHVQAPENVSRCPRCATNCQIVLTMLMKGPHVVSLDFLPIKTKIDQQPTCSKYRFLTNKNQDKSTAHMWEQRINSSDHYQQPTSKSRFISTVHVE